jgi:hypothetical protein
MYEKRKYPEARVTDENIAWADGQQKCIIKVRAEVPPARRVTAGSQQG